MNPPTAAVPPLPASAIPSVRPRALVEGERLLPTLIAAGALTVLGDFLFWNHTPGLSLAIYFAAVAVVMLLRHGRAALKARVLVPAALLLASAVQTAVEMSFTNLAVITALFAILMGELCYRQLKAGWTRWSESFVAWFAGAGRWLWVALALNEQPLSKPGVHRRLGESFARILRIALPAAALLVVFAVVFSSGNRIFAEYVGRFGGQFQDWFLSFDFSILRIFFWMFLGTIALVFVRPRTSSGTPRSWTDPIAEWRRPDAGVAFWQSVMILAALNALFFAVNTIDVIYLWMHTAVPAGMSGKEFLHEGVNSLITATVLAGIVLSVLFQQSAEVTQSRALKGLAFAWIAQNLVLIAAVFLRLKIYVDTEEMTAKRVYVASFLLLVTLGFAFLCAHVRRGRTVSRVIWRCAAATFALFFVMQFPDVIGWVCRYNVERGPKRGEGHGFNIAYQLTLGPNAWPVLLEKAESLPPGEVRDNLRIGLREVARIQYARPWEADWRERQFRTDHKKRALADWAARQGDLTAIERELPIIKAYYQTRNALR
jgi:hypothetical protein